MKPQEFVKDHKVEIGVGVVAVTAATVGFAYRCGYKAGYSSGVKHFVTMLNALKDAAKETGKAVPTIVRGLNDSGIEIPIKVFPEIVEDFAECTSLVK